MSVTTSTNALITIDELVWRTKSYATTLDAVRDLKGSGALQIVENKVMAKIDYFMGAECAITLPDVTIVEAGSNLL